MDKITRLSAQDRANLVAYLDGELDEVATRAIEETLAKSPVARHDVNMLVRTFNLLDELPRPSLGGEFTTRTISLATSEESPAVRAPFQWPQPLRSDAARRGGICVLWVAGLVLAAVGGFLLTNRWLPNDAQLLVDELPVIESLDDYVKVESIEFLRELQARGVDFHDEAKPRRE